MTHTPGPWEIVRHANIVGTAAYDVADVRSPYPQTPADARLIAAAPALLEAMENLLEVLAKFGPQNPTPPIFAAKVRAANAIALAKGEKA